MVKFTRVAQKVFHTSRNFYPYPFMILFTVPTKYLPYLKYGIFFGLVIMAIAIGILGHIIFGKEEVNISFSFKFPFIWKFNVGELVNPIYKFEHALTVPGNAEEILKIFADVKRHLPDNTLENDMKVIFFGKKRLLLSLEIPTEDDLKTLKVMEDNIKSLVESYEAEKSLEQEFCDVYGPVFTVLFETVKDNPSAENADIQVRIADMFFPAAKMFCKGLPESAHPAYEYSSLEDYLVEQIQMPEFDYNYVRILRLIKPYSIWAFSDCPDDVAVKAKLPDVIAEQARVFSECENANLKDNVLNLSDLKEM